MAHDAVDLEVQVGRLLGQAGDDQRRARLVDEDRVDLVDDGVVEAPLRVEILQRELHVVAQVVEAELVVGAVGDVGTVGLAALGVVHLVQDAAGGQAEEAVDLAHPLDVAAGQVVVDRDHDHALAGERVQVDRQGRGRGLALAGLHLGDAALVQDHAADQLDIVVALAEHAAGRLANHGKGLGQQFVDRGALGKALAELDRLAGQLAVRERLDGRLEFVDDPHRATVLLDHPIVLAAENLCQDPSYHHVSPVRGLRPRRGKRKRGGGGTAGRQPPVCGPVLVRMRASSSQSGNLGQCRQSLQILWGRFCLSVSAKPILRKKPAW